MKAVAAPLPLTVLADDVAALNRSIERMPGRSSWRGMPMPARSSGLRDPSA